ncbi:hypothetical protein JCM14635_40570 [Megalodesulfovibrio paquesii]
MHDEERPQGHTFSPICPGVSPEERLAECRRIIELAGEGFFLMDEALKITQVNDALVTLMGRSKSQLVGRHPWSFFDKATQAMLAVRRRTFIRQDQRHFRAVIIRPDGTSVPVMIHGTRLRDHDGKPAGHFVFVTDMTEEERPLNMAREVQALLLPKTPPEMPGLELAGRCLPSHAVGGDYYDYIIPYGADDRLQLALGDVSGHGVEAALLMASVRGMVRMRATRPGSILEIVSDLNVLLCEDLWDSGRFMTFMLCCLDVAKEELRWVRAGQDPGLLWRAATGEIIRLGGKGMVLGAELSAEFEESALPLEPGDCICLSSDGLREALDGHGHGTMFGWERMEAALRSGAPHGAQGIVEALESALLQHTRGMPLEDDVTMVAARFLGRARG